MGETETTEKTLAGFGITLDEGREALEESKERQRRWAERDGRICVCGHAVRAHMGRPGQMLCKPARMECPCRLTEPVLDVQDTRLFQYATTGPGKRHALLKGVIASVEREKSWEWLEGVLVCRICEVETGEVIPAAVTPHGGVVDRPEKMNGLLCPECFTRLGGVVR